LKTKMLSFKPLKNKETTIYLESGINLHELIDLIGQDVIIEPAEGKEETPVDDGLKAIIAMIQNYRDANKKLTDENIESIEEASEPVDAFEFGEGK